MNSKIAAVIIVQNEEIHIRRCLDSIKNFVDEIHIIDSSSRDLTLTIVNEYKCSVYQYEWQNSYSKKYNWALSNIDTKCDWILRIDADEFINKNLEIELKNFLTKKNYKTYNCIMIPRVIKFLGKELKYGGMYPIFALRIFPKDYGFCQKKLMDEHIALKQIEARPYFTKNYFIDENLKGLSDWLSKHNTYALKEAIDYIIIKNIFSDTNLTHNNKNSKKIYDKFPLFIRPVLFFIYRYFIRLGFLDGFSGFSWHFLQCLWYRMLVDIRIYEICREYKKSKTNFNDFVYKRYGISTKFE